MQLRFRKLCVSITSLSISTHLNIPLRCHGYGVVVTHRKSHQVCGHLNAFLKIVVLIPVNGLRAVARHVGEAEQVGIMCDGYVESGLHGRLVKTGKRPPGVCGLKHGRRECPAGSTYEFQAGSNRRAGGRGARPPSHIFKILMS